MGTTASVLSVGAVLTGGAILLDAPPSQSELVARLSAPPDASAAARQAQVAARQAQERTVNLSRSAQRLPVGPKVQLSRRQPRPQAAVQRSVHASSGDPRAIARSMLADFGFSSDQFGCLDALWTKESGWNPAADNPTSSAYGIPQALPGSKMASAGADWATNPATQIRWGLGYIRDSYGSPCAALAQSEASGWY